MDLPCSALDAIQLPPVPPPCPSLHVLPSFTDMLSHRNSLCVCVCVLTPPCPARVCCSGLSHSCGCCFCFLPLLFSVMKSFGLLWARGMLGAGNAGRRVSEEHCWLSTLPVSYSFALGHVWRQLEPLHGHWRRLHTQGGVSPWVMAHCAVMLLAVYPPWRGVFAVLLSCLHPCFSAVLPDVSLAWHYQVWDHLWKWRGAVLAVSGPAVE